MLPNHHRLLWLFTMVYYMTILDVFTLPYKYKISRILIWKIIKYWTEPNNPREQNSNYFWSKEKLAKETLLPHLCPTFMAGLRSTDVKQDNIVFYLSGWIVSRLTGQFSFLHYGLLSLFERHKTWNWLPILKYVITLLFQSWLPLDFEKPYNAKLVFFKSHSCFRIIPWW